MRYRDQPTAEVTERVQADPDLIWALITDIELPARFSDELQSVEWMDGVAAVAVGNRASKGAFDEGGQLPPVLDNVRLTKGWFDQTCHRSWPPRRALAFVHLDADTNVATGTCSNSCRIA